MAAREKGLFSEEVPKKGEDLEDLQGMPLKRVYPVSYTHLTLPTKRIV